MVLILEARLTSDQGREERERERERARPKAAAVERVGCEAENLTVFL